MSERLSDASCKLQDARCIMVGELSELAYDIQENTDANGVPDQELVDQHRALGSSIAQLDLAINDILSAGA